MIGFAFVLYLCGLAGCDTVRYYVDECTAEAYADLRTEAWLEGLEIQGADCVRVVHT